MKPKYYIYTAAKGSPENKKMYFNTYEEAHKFIKTHAPPGPPKGIYHIFPVDNSGYASKSEGRTSFGEGNKMWEKKQQERKR